MAQYNINTIVLALSISVGGAAFAQASDSKERWFPQLKRSLPIVPVQQPSQPDMPDVQAFTAQECSERIKPFETLGTVDQRQSSKGIAMASPPILERAMPPAPGMAAPAPSAAAGTSSPASKAMENSAVASMMVDESEKRSAKHPSRQQQDGPLRAGFVDDNADFAGYLSFLGKHNGIIEEYRNRDTSERYGIDVRDKNGKPIHGAVISMDLGQGNLRPVAVSDVHGRAWVFPKAVSSQHGRYELSVRFGQSSQHVVLISDRKARTDVKLDTLASSDVPRLDLSILIDTTGSMSDEIRKLQRTLTQVVGEIQQQGVDVCVNVTAYRDVSDDYILKGIDFTSNLSGVQEFVNKFEASGGGDEPEALNQALDHVVNRLSWRKQNNVVRTVMMITDAPPKMDTSPVFYDRSMLAAGAQGIRVHSVGTSGLNTQGGELVLRQVAQYTGGKFVFLTYKDAKQPSRGSGDATVHDVSNYSVDTLDALLLRLVKDDLGVVSQR